MNPRVDNTRSRSGRTAIEQLSIAVIGPDESLRTTLLEALSECQVGQVHEFLSYPPRVQDVNNLLELKSNIVIIEMDSDRDYAVEIVRAVCASGNSTVMVYSTMPDSEAANSELLMRCMRLGAREFLNPPFRSNQLLEALERAASRQLGAVEPKGALGRLMAFCAAKGGAGVTNIACNFAIALASQSGQKTLLVDMDLPLGDVALNLGLTSVYSTIDALQNSSRLDSTFLSRLLVHHSSGLAVLPSPGRFPAQPTSNAAIERLLSVARCDFDNVVVDLGSKCDLTNGSAALKEATILYLITQNGIPELRNAQQLIVHCQSLGVERFEIVLNRYEHGGSEISDGDVVRALDKVISWKIPNEYRSVRRMQDTSVPVVGTDTSIARQIEAMARAACGLPAVPPRGRESSLRRWFTRTAKKAERLEVPTIPKMAFTPTADSIATTGLESGNAQHEPMLDRRSQSPWNC